MKAGLFSGTISCAALTLAVLVPSAASAETVDTPTVSEFRERLTATVELGYSVAQFDALSAAQKQIFMAGSLDPTSQPNYVEYVEEPVITESRKAPELDYPDGTAAYATTYNVRSYFKKCARFFGVSTTCGNMRYKYQTRAGKVVTSSMCTQSYTGNTTGNSIQVSTDHWLSAGRGYCEGMANVQAIWKIGWSYDQEGWLHVDGYRVIAAGFRNV